MRAAFVGIEELIVCSHYILNHIYKSGGTWMREMLKWGRSSLQMLRKTLRQFIC